MSIEKQDFYHGAAIIRLLDDDRCKSVQREGIGYIVNDQTFVVLKYTAKSRSPWTFTFSQEEVARLNKLAIHHRKIVITMICAGDGICAISWKQAFRLLGDKAGWIAARRKFREQYSVSGPNARMGKKISFREWPSIVFLED